MPSLEEKVNAAEGSSCQSRRRMRGRLASALTAVFVFAAAISTAAPEPVEKPVINLYVFLSPDCPTCEPVKEDVLKKTAERLGCRIEPRYFDVEEMANYRILVAYEGRFKDTENDLPVVIIADRLLGGVDEVKADLADLLSKYAPTGVAAVPLPTPEEIEMALHIPAVERPVHAVFFDRPGCRKCGRADHLLAYFQNELGRTDSGDERFAVERVVAADKDARLRHEVLGERAGLSEDKRLVAPAVFIGTDALVDNRLTDSAVTGLILKYRRGAAAPKPPTREEITAATARLNERFRAIGFATVLAGGLIDGINPCAFVTLIFLVGYLTASGRRGAEILLVGCVFMIAVFCAYFMIGVGLATAVETLGVLPRISRAFTWALIAMSFGLAALSAWDLVLALGGRSGELKVGLPSFLRRRLSLAVAKEFRTRTVVVAAFVSGFLVSFLELVCTGQIYLPLIRVMISFSASRSRALVFLLVYNAAFVLPLAVTFCAVYAGITSERLTQFLHRHLALGKLLMLVLFAAMGVLLVVIG